MALMDRVQEDLKLAMKAREALRVSALRMLLSELKNSAIAAGGVGIVLDDPTSFSVVRRLIKQREESAEAFGKAGRAEQAQKETQEAAMLAAYLPQGLTDAELEALVDRCIVETGASSLKEMGRVVKQALAEAGGRADGGRVSAVARRKLGG